MLNKILAHGVTPRVNADSERRSLAAEMPILRNYVQFRGDTSFSLRDASELNDVSLNVSSKSFTGQPGLLINIKPQTAFAA
ncbi:hypothetical protein [Bacillus sp. (in: firmicutes)]|uniref:hypothetical protein n=1 Tax=Bacillus sp. TaxID=1409 RepID=UPI0023F2BECF|nr:hypothetical protein [Bacillus sp. (in: firmicutes)]